MNLGRTLRASLVPITFASAASVFAACDTIEDACDLGCPDEGVLEGNASISGIKSIDAFFGAVIDFGAVAAEVNGSVRAELDAMALGLGLEKGAPAADISAAIEAKVAANVEGGLTVNIQEPRCEASVEATASAVAQCEADVDPGSVEVSCEGSCTIDASAQAECSASGTLTCKGQAPNLQCEGTCTGDCSLDVSAECSGTCRGECTGTCTVMDSTGACKGKCEGTCQGTCELDAGGSCSGKCEGSCEYTPPSGECEASAEARCEASADANISCEGGCDGTAKPPEVSAECEATVEAKASAKAECTPPAIDISWQFAAGLDADAQAEFSAWVQGFKVQLGALVAATAKAELLVGSGTVLLETGVDAIASAAQELTASTDLRASVGAGCALLEVELVADTMQTSLSGLQQSVDGVLEIRGAVE